MVQQELVHDLDDSLLNMDAYLNNHEEDLWSTDGQVTQDGEDDFLNSSGLQAEVGDETDEEEIKVEPNSTSILASMSVTTDIADSQAATVKQESTPEHDEEENEGIDEIGFDGCGCSCEEEAGENGDEVKYECKSAPTCITGNGVEMLDDGAWLDLDGVGSDVPSMISPTFLRRFSMENKGTGIVDTELLNGDDTDDSLFLSAEDMIDYYNFTEADMAALVPSPSGSANISASNNANAALTMPLPSPTVFQPHHASTHVLVSEQDIPDMVNLFSSMYSPSQTVRNQTQLPYQYQHQSTSTQPASQQPPLSIMVPSTQLYNTMFPFGTATPPVSTLPFEYYTPPTLTTNHVLDPNSIFLAAADAMSPPTKNHTTMYQSHAHAAAAAALQRHNQPSTHHLAPNQTQQQAQHMQAVAVAFANSQAAMNTMRKLNTTYGVPIAPLQRSILETQTKLNPTSQSSKPKLTSATLPINSTKVSKISITPDISDFKLVQIFHHFCDPVTKVISLQRFHQLLQHHQVKDDHTGSSSHNHAIAAAAALAQAQGHAPPTTNITPSAETQALFEILDKKGQGFLDLEIFMSSFQICNRCTEAKRRAHSAICAAQGQSFVPTALERQLMEDVAPVIVRVVPTSFEGHKVKSCEHYQWTWCEGFEKSGNEKCKGTNRHDKCPKYLANCTLWKHKLPPKNRKSKIFENVESPSKKLRHFA